jgi:hypothetical protein
VDQERMDDQEDGKWDEEQRLESAVAGAAGH